MADTTQDIWNDNDGVVEKRSARRKKHTLRNLLVFILILVVVLGVILLAAYRDGTGFDVLRRYLNYGGSSTTETTGSETGYSFMPAQDNRFAVLEDRLVVLSGTSLKLLDNTGKELWSTSVKMSSPALVEGGGRVAAYDIGGTELYVLDKNGPLPVLDQNGDPVEMTESILSVSLNAKGFLAVTAQAKNFKGCVSVYNEELRQVFDFNSSSRFVIDGYVTNDGSTLAAVTLGQESSVFVSDVVLYDLTETEPKANYDIEDGLVAAIGQQGDRIVTVSDTCLTLADSKGEIRNTYSYKDLYLREFDLHGDDFTVLLLNRYQSGSVGRLVSIGSNGEELGSVDVNREVLNVSACGRYVAVLYVDGLVIYNRDLEPYATAKDTEAAKSVVMRPDGSALLMGSESAGLYLP